MNLPFAFASLLLLTLASAQNWALIVAGSSGYYNYRHQADAFHAYKMVREHGFDRSHIVTMMYDDIAKHGQNPFKGNIINYPGGPNVYNSDIDYKGTAVSAANFLKILSGDKAAMARIGTGRVVESGPNDNIFVFFSDHGAPGILAFPYGGYLHARDLQDVFTRMKAANKYKEIVLYIEACESGSMFQNILPTNMNIYAATAANAVESSWACYWDDDRNAYLGDTFAVSFLEDCDVANMKTETLQQQFDRVKALTTESHAQQYGTLSMATKTLNNYLVGNASAYFPVLDALNTMVRPPPREKDQVSSRDIKIATFLRTLPKLVPGSPAHEEMMREIDLEMAHRARADRRAFSLVHAITGKSHAEVVTKTNGDYPTDRAFLHCLAESVEAFEAECGVFSDYSLSHIRTLAHLCEQGHSHEEIAAAAQSICRK